jgi:hypothetical protein
MNIVVKLWSEGVLFAGDFGNIACNFGKVHNELLCAYGCISRVDAAGFVMRYLTTEYSVLHLLQY